MAKKILIVEDEVDILRLAKLRLEKAGYETLEATDNVRAMDMIIEKRPDLILLDLLLPGERGEELCKKLKSDEKLKSIPVILFTATARDITKKVRETGADDGILKPFEPEHLLKKIKKFIG